MSSVEEFEGDDIPELEGEEALSENKDATDLDEEPVAGEVAHRPLVPLDHRGVSKVSLGDEHRLRNNYDIPPLVLLHFQNPVSREIRGGDIVLYEQMLLAGVWFPFPDISRELVLFLGFCPSQIGPNAWRYLFASFILWRSVLEARMTIPEFFNVYKATYKREGVVEFTVRNNPIFIYLSPNYSNNRGWRSEFFQGLG
jgi:hypothetical protein